MPTLAALCAVATAAFAAWNAYITARLKQYIAECREADKRELREWINGSFMRSSVVDARIDGLKERLQELRKAA
jgi:hypothetical protein